jgi:hypothetical protein
MRRMLGDIPALASRLQQAIAAQDDSYFPALTGSIVQEFPGGLAFLQQVHFGGIGQDEIIRLINTAGLGLDLNDPTTRAYAGRFRAWVQGHSIESIMASITGIPLPTMPAASAPPPLSPPVSTSPVVAAVVPSSDGLAAIVDSYPWLPWVAVGLGAFLLLRRK